jgi:hypothetical protein
VIPAPHYATQAQAEADAARITGAPFGLGWLAAHLRRLLADPRADSNVILLQADALRATATSPDATASPAARATLRTWANTLTDLAPTRADPIAAGSQPAIEPHA